MSDTILEAVEPTLELRLNIKSRSFSRSFSFCAIFRSTNLCTADIRVLSRDVRVMGAELLSVEWGLNSFLLNGLGGFISEELSELESSESEEVVTTFLKLWGL